MKKLRYNIYSNIDDGEYLAIQDELISLEAKMVENLHGKGWNLKYSVASDDGLNINFFKKETIFYGSLSIVFLDKVDVVTFTMTISKSFDESGIRYILRDNIFTNETFNVFVNHISEFLDNGLKMYNDWSKTDILNLGDKIDLTSE